MSTETRHSDTEAHPPTWWVRDPQSGRYGPVTFEILKSWASDGRIGPANEISKDGVEWSPATAEPALKMEWVAEVEVGRFYGPIHGDAVRGLINDGAIARHAVLFRRAELDARDTEAECQRLTEALQQALAARAESEAALQQSLAACEEALGQARSDVTAWADRFRQAEADLEHSRTDAREWHARFQDAEARQGELERQREEQSAAWQMQRQSMQQQLQALEQQSAVWQMQRQSMQQQLQALEQQSVVWQQQRQSMQQQLQVVEEAYQTAQRERADWQAEAQRALSEAATRQQVIARLEAEADVLRKMTAERPAMDAVIDAEVLPPERPDEAQRLRPPRKPPVAAGVPGAGFTGLSLTELERQAQRELERLGARGQAFFAKKR